MRPELLAAPLSFDAALDLVRKHAIPIARTETVLVTDAVGRVAAGSIASPLDVPPFDRSAMDGFAVRAADVADASRHSPAQLTCIGRVLAGQIPAQTVTSGTCVEIATGAPIPAGADGVVMVERTSRAGDLVAVHEPVPRGQNIGRRGADIATGQIVVGPGHLITPARAGALAAVGVGDVQVFARPTVAILSTGSEIATTRQPAGAGQIFDVNSTTLSGVVAEHGGVPDALPPVADNTSDLIDVLGGAALTHDIVVCSGGSSVGARDLLTDAMAELGRVVFHGIAVKPGKPTLFGFVGQTPLFGMPGNPTSCLSNAYLLLVPFLRLTARLPSWRPMRIEVPLAQRIVSNAGRHQFYSVRVDGGKAYPAFKSSGDITSMAGADGYIEIAADVSAVEAGTPVLVTLF
jgi:molybdenum cofactor synthesis domain-containing protein